MGIELLRLPFELRLQIWQLILGPTSVNPCQCQCATETPSSRCPSNHCDRGGFNIYHLFDMRILRVNRQIHQEVHSLLASSPKKYHVCNGVCLENLFLGIKPRDRRWIRHVRVNLYVGDIPSEVLLEESQKTDDGMMLLRCAEARCGPYVQSALKCQGVGDLVRVVPVDVDGDGDGGVETDEMGRRILLVDLTLE